MKKTVSLLSIFCLLLQMNVAAQATDANAPLHAMKPDYTVPYGVPKTEEVKKVLDNVFNYLDNTTPAQLINKQTKQPVALSAIDSNTIFKQGDYRLTSYEWGVTYAGMLAVSAATKDEKFANYSKTRLNLIADAYPAFNSLFQTYKSQKNPLRSVIEPHALDDAGAVCAATIKTLQMGGQANLRPVIDNFISYISTKEFRFADGTLARNRPLKNTLWLDDLFMSVPALAQMGKLTGNVKYYDDATKQILQFSARMFNKEKGVYMHGWVNEMDVHPQFHWGRANGWAFLAMTELLDVLPKNHPKQKAILAQYQALAKGLMQYQSGQGFWHQLLDKQDSYLETSATAIYTYCYARGINKGWLNAKAFAPTAMLGWNAVSTKVTAKGQVDGTCVGTGMAFDPAFYYYRPVNVYAAHSYGPVLLAGAEIISLLNNHTFEINDSALQLTQ
ncbi:MAG: glycoside hydrolase family 88 protein [Pedobacter sp.]|nr:glycoside hydrolase family 88 protein [Chitinophagaceae bacterium]